MICEVEGLPVHYLQFGAGTPILILHGWDGNAAWFSHRLERVIQWPSRSQRVYLDLPGHGRTPVSPEIRTSDDILRVISGFAETLFAGGNYLLLGLSYGGYLARGLIHHSAGKIDGVCLLVPMIFPSDANRSPATLEVFEDHPPQTYRIPPAHKNMYELLAARNERTFLQLREYLALYDEAPGDVDFRKGMRPDVSRLSLSFDVDDLPAPFGKPSLIVTARQDSVVGYKDAWLTLDKYPRATFVLLDRTGHLLETQDDNLAYLIPEWLMRAGLDS